MARADRSSARKAKRNSISDALEALVSSEVASQSSSHSDDPKEWIPTTNNTEGDEIAGPVMLADKCFYNLLSRRKVKKKN